MPTTTWSRSSPNANASLAPNSCSNFGWARSSTYLPTRCSPLRTFDRSRPSHFGARDPRRTQRSIDRAGIYGGLCRSPPHDHARTNPDVCRATRWLASATLRFSLRRRPAPVIAAYFQRRRSTPCATEYSPARWHHDCLCGSSRIWMRTLIKHHDFAHVVNTHLGGDVLSRPISHRAVTRRGSYRIIDLAGQLVFA